MVTPEQMEDILTPYLKIGDVGIELMSLFDNNVTRGDMQAVGKKNGVTVKYLSGTDGDTQLAIINVNIYAKDIDDPDHSEGYVNRIPNQAVIERGTALVMEALKGNNGLFWKNADSTGNLYISSFSPVYRTIELDQHFRAIRVTMRVNTLAKEFN